MLGAYATHNKAVGYCQSMNYLVAHMLIFLGEEESFWLLARPAYPSPSPDFVPGLPHVTLIELRLALIFVPGLPHAVAHSQAAIVEESLPVGYYTDDMQGVYTDLLVLTALLQEAIPDVAASLSKLEVPLELLCSKWLLCMFGLSLPRHTLYRLWDVVIWEGSHMLLAGCLAAIDANREAIV